MRRKAKSLICFWLSYVVFLSSAWKNVGMTIACHRCDVKQSLFEIFFSHRKAVSRDLFIYVHICVFSASLSYSWTIIISTHTRTQTPLNTHTHMHWYRVETDPKVIQSVLVSLKRLLSQNVSRAGTLRALCILLHVSVPPCWIPCITHSCCGIATACVCLVNNTSDISYICFHSQSRDGAKDTAQWWSAGLMIWRSQVQCGLYYLCSLGKLWPFLTANAANAIAVSMVLSQLDCWNSCLRGIPSQQLRHLQLV